MKRSNGCRTCSRNRNAFQASAYQKVPESHFTESHRRMQRNIAFASYKMDAAWKNVSVEPGGILDFAHNFSSDGDYITRVAPGEYRLSEPGVYLANLQLHMLHPGQIVFVVNGEEQFDSVAGSSAENALLRSFYIIRAENADSVLSVCNPMQSLRSLTVSAYTGGGLSVTSDLFIIKLL